MDMAFLAVYCAFVLSLHLFASFIDIIEEITAYPIADYGVPTNFKKQQLL